MKLPVDILTSPYAQLRIKELYIVRIFTAKIHTENEKNIHLR